MPTPSGKLVTPVGFDAAGTLLAFLLDSSGRLIVDAPSPSSVRPINEASLFNNLNLPAGLSTQIGVTVPAGELWRLTSVGMQYTGTVAGVVMRLYVYDGANSIIINRVTPVVSLQPYITLISALMSAGWSLRVDVNGATAGDDLSIFWFAERIE